MTDIAIAYDVPTLEQALALDTRLGADQEVAKIGLELFTAAGPEAVRALKARGRRVFLDLKLHDIPNTVRGAARAAASLGADLITAHATGGRAMIAAAVEGAGPSGAKIIAVTVLTSLDADHMPPGFQTPFSIARVAPELLDMAESAGAAGIVCAATDLPGIRAAHPRPFYAVTPGVRFAGTAANDQERVATVAEAVRLGSSMLVLGRAVTAAADPAAALAAARAQCLEATRQPATHVRPSA